MTVIVTAVFYPKAGKKAGQPTKVPAAPATDGGALDTALNGKVSATLTDGGAVLGVGEDAIAEHHPAHIWDEQPGRHLQQCRLAGRVRADQRQRAAGGHLEVDIEIAHRHPRPYREWAAVRGLLAHRSLLRP